MKAITEPHHHHASFFVVQCREWCDEDRPVCLEPACPHQGHESRGLDEAWNPYPDEDEHGKND